MFMAMFPGLVYMRLEDDTRKQLESGSKVRRIIFERLTIGINVIGTDVYQDVADWLLTVPEENLKTITMEDVIKGAGEYVDESGRLE